MPQVNLAWYYWLLTDVLLILGVTVTPWGLYAAITLTAVQSLHFRQREGSWQAFPVQVRLAYLGLLLIALWPPLVFVIYLQIIGTTAMVLFNYCFLARCLSLLPWNRDMPFGAKLFFRTFFSAPVSGSVQHGALSPAEKDKPAESSVSR